jgi:hypothetical protein
MPKGSKAGRGKFPEQGRHKEFYSSERNKRRLEKKIAKQNRTV